MVNHDAEFVAMRHLADAALSHAGVLAEAPEQVLDRRNGCGSHYKRR